MRGDDRLRNRFFWRGIMGRSNKKGQWSWKEEWTQDQIWTAIRKAMENERKGPNLDYWTTGISRDRIKEKYGLTKFIPDPVTVTLTRECCGRRFVHVLTSRESAKYLTDPKCFDPDCRKRVPILPFGKYAGLRISLIYEQDPGYLAWFHETVEGCEEIKEVIHGLDGIETHLTAFRERPKLRRQLTPTQQEVEWLMGKFTAPTINIVCEELFGGDA